MLRSTPETNFRPLGGITVKRTIGLMQLLVAGAGIGGAIAMSDALFFLAFCGAGLESIGRMATRAGLEQGSSRATGEE